MREQREHQLIIEALLAELEHISQQCDGQFPLYRLPGEKYWKTSRRGSWLGGFWAALWWQKATITGKARDVAEAQAWSQRLQVQLEEPSINRNFVFWYGTALHSSHPAAGEAKQLAEQARATLLSDFDIGLGGWWLGTGMGAGEKGALTVDVDALAPTLALLRPHPGSARAELGHRHLRLCLEILAEPSGAWSSNSVKGEDGLWHRAKTVQWARGQAWAMLGLAEAVDQYGGEYLHAANLACEYWAQHWGNTAAVKQLIGNEVDPCAIAIASVALLRLWQRLPGSSFWRELACQQIEGLLSDEVRNGRFAGHYYRISEQQTSLVETPCATFFLLEALRAQGHTCISDGASSSR